MKTPKPMKWETVIRQINMRQAELMGTTSVKQLADATGIEYDRLRRIKKEPGVAHMYEFVTICRALHMDPSILKEV